MADLLIYDVHVDEHRPITQAEVDQLQRATMALSMYRKAVEEIGRMARAVVVDEMALADFQTLVHPFLGETRDAAPVTGEGRPN